MIFAPGMIAALKRRGVRQTISEDGPASHKSKAGTPTMGGLIIIAGILGGTLAGVWFFRPFTSPQGSSTSWIPTLFALLVLGLSYGALGFIDDYLTIHPVGQVRGISSKPKSALQILLAAGFLAYLAIAHKQTFSPVLFVGGTQLISGWLYWAFALFFMVGMANFVNISDGLDGLVSGLVAIAAIAFTLLLIFVGLRHATESREIALLMPAIAGACLAFLWFNANPARVFMGDTGALAIGVLLPAVAIITHTEIPMIILSLVFVFDGLSSALQWAVFKFTRITTGTGRRVFKKSPIHHHFELSGWSEQTVVVRFWICGVIAALMTLAGIGMEWW
jgi:phospho-N-acetylmuramoyl-pentapeptide-transferase